MSITDPSPGGIDLGEANSGVCNANDARVSGRALARYGTSSASCTCGRDVRHQKEAEMPAKTEKQRRFMGAELERKREGKETKTHMSEAELEKYASKDKKKN